MVQSVCFTGTHSAPRAALATQATEAGFKFTNNISTNLTYLVIGDNAKMSTKLRGAIERGISVITESQWAARVAA